MEDKIRVADDMAVSIAYDLTVDGIPQDSASLELPLVYLHGHDNIISGLEDALKGMGIGDNKVVTIEPEQAYGDYDPECVIELERSEFPEGFNLELNTPLHLRDDSNQLFTGFITAFDDEKVTVDLNHPLAGRTLVFDVEVVDIRPATPQELSQGSIHSGCSCGCDDCSPDSCGGCC